MREFHRLRACGPAPHEVRREARSCVSTERLLTQRWEIAQKLISQIPPNMEKNLTRLLG